MARNKNWIYYIISFVYDSWICIVSNKLNDFRLHWNQYSFQNTTLCVLETFKREREINIIHKLSSLSFKMKRSLKIYSTNRMWRKIWHPIISKTNCKSIIFQKVFEILRNFNKYFLFYYQRIILKPVPKISFYEYA